MTEDAGKIAYLISQEGTKLEVNTSILKKSELCMNMIEDEPDDDENPDDAQELPMPNVKDDILQKVIEFLKHRETNEFQEIEKPLKSADMKDVVSEWDAVFVDVDTDTLYALTLAANYMCIKDLLELTCAKVSSYNLLLGCEALLFLKKTKTEMRLPTTHRALCFLLTLFGCSSSFVQVASMCKGKNPEEIRLALNITNDYTPEEEKKAQEEYNWTTEY
jgi:S-phase kinase-associated protein 1